MKVKVWIKVGELHQDGRAQFQKFLMIRRQKVGVRDFAIPTEKLLRLFDRDRKAITTGDDPRACEVG
jgi:hypothetical protein